MRKIILGLVAIAAIATPLAFATSANAAAPTRHHDLPGSAIDGHLDDAVPTTRCTGGHRRHTGRRPGAATGSVRRARRPP